MLHIDEGQLHALLDEALDAGEADTVRQHIAACGECAVRYDDERAIRARANAILELARPLPSTIPPFETVVQRAQSSVSSASRVAIPGPMRLAWAATIVLALGMGWLSRGFSPLADRAFESSNASDAMADAAPQSAEVPPSPTAPVAPPPSAELGPRNVAGIGAATGGAVSGRADAPALSQQQGQRVREEAVADQALITQAKTAASNAAGAQAPQLQQVQGTIADRSELRRDTGAAAARLRAAEFSGARRDSVREAARSRAAVAAPPPVAVVASPPPRPRWEYLDLVTAEQRVGATIPVIPGLQVDSVSVSREPGGFSVRVIHRLPGGGLFELRQEPQVASQALELRERRQLESVAEPIGFFNVTISKGNLLLTGRAQLAPDSIRALLNRAR